MTDLAKRYVLSSAVTFLSTFFVILGTNASQISSPSMLTTSAVAGLFMVAGRAAFKAVVEAVVGGHADLPSLTSTPTAQQ